MHDRSIRQGLATGSLVAIIAGAVALLSVGIAIGIVVTQPETDPSSAAAVVPTSPSAPGPGATVDIGEPSTPPSTAPSATPVTARPRGDRQGRAAAGGVPVLIEPPTIQFGRIEPGEIVTGSVSVRNVGERPLRILQTKASCKCTTIDLANTVIPAGESVSIEAELDPGHALGTKNSGLRILFEGYADVVQVGINAVVALPVGVRPPYINAFERGAGDAALAGELIVESDQPFEVLSFDGRPPPFVDFDRATDEPRDRYRLAYDLTRYDPQTCVDAEGNPMPTWLPIEVDHPDCGVVDVQVRHFCTRQMIPPEGHDWMLSERRVLAGRLGEGESYEFTVQMLWIRGATPDAIIQEATSESPDFSAELVDVRRTGDEILATVRVTPTPGFRGLLRGDVRLGTGRHSATILVFGRAVE